MFLVFEKKGRRSFRFPQRPLLVDNRNFKSWRDQAGYQFRSAFSRSRYKGVYLLVQRTPRFRAASFSLKKGLFKIGIVVLVGVDVVRDTHR